MALRVGRLEQGIMLAHMNTVDALADIHLATPANPVATHILAATLFDIIYNFNDGSVFTPEQLADAAEFYDDSVSPYHIARNSIAKLCRTHYLKRTNRP